ncbi:MAG: nucleoside kinase [Bacteroidales bacterium]|jgi:uridine kinase|nr:nucleoside kinase [Bacteroidales bacterium]
MKTLHELNRERNGADAGKYLAALVDNRLKCLDYILYNPHEVQFVDYSHPDGRRTYIRSLSFVLQKAVKEVFPQAKLRISYSVVNSLYCNLVFPDAREETDRDMELIRQAMTRIIEQDIPFRMEKIPTEEAQQLFEKAGFPQKALLQKTRGHFYTTVYTLDQSYDTFYGPLVPSAGYLKLFYLRRFYKGFLLQYPHPDNPARVDGPPKLHKLVEVFEEYVNWGKVMGVRDVGSLNQKIQNGETKDLILIGEALHSRRYAAIADTIFGLRDKVRLVLVAGPSSSGKTTTSKRISKQLKVLGMQPVVLEMDNYFVDRENTPRDENGDFDFESLQALDVAFLNKQLFELLDGKEIEVPLFDFLTGKRAFNGKKLRLQENQVLIMEGIHALNPVLTKNIPEDNKFRIYASALTSLAMDENNRISTTDTRMIRRMVRDAQFRGISAEETILRWPSISYGERQNIFPFQEEADVMFNSALPYELAVLKSHAEPLLHRIPPVSKAYPEALRLLNFLSYFTCVHPTDERYIPYVSVIREFIGTNPPD